MVVADGRNFNSHSQTMHEQQTMLMYNKFIIIIFQICLNRYINYILKQKPMANIKLNIHFLTKM